MNAFQPLGTWTALVTPFGANGRLDVEALRRLIEFQIAEGVSGLVPCGTTGESPTISWEEHHALVEQTVRIAGKRVGVIAGAGSNCTDEAVQAAEQAREAGADAALLVDCYYNGPSSVELREEYYQTIVNRVPELPLIPYVIPGRSGTALAAADLALLHLKQPRRIPAVKEATGDLDRMRQTRALAGDGLTILSGDDGLTLAMMRDEKIRAAGVISVMSNVAPRAVARMTAAQRSGHSAEAAAWQEALAPLFAVVGCAVDETRRLPDGQTATVADKYRNPVPVKTMMVGLGFPSGLCRRPLGRMSKAGVEKVRAALIAVFRARPDVLTPINEAFDVNVEKRLNDDAVWAALAR